MQCKDLPTRAVLSLVYHLCESRELDSGAGWEMTRLGVPEKLACAKILNLGLEYGTGPMSPFFLGPDDPARKGLFDLGGPLPLEEARAQIRAAVEKEER